MAMKQPALLRVALFSWLLAAAAVISVNLLFPPDLAQLPIALLFGLLIVFSDTFSIPSGGGYISLLPLITVTTFLVLGLAYSASLVFLAANIHGVIRWYFAQHLGITRPANRSQLVTLVAANCTMFTVSILVSGTIFQSFGVPLPLQAVSREVVSPFALLLITFFVTNHLMAAAFFFLRGRAFLQAYYSGFSGALLYEITAVTFAPLVALIYTRLGSGYFVMFTLALIMASVVMHNLDQVRQRLERRVQELGSLQAISQTLSASLSLDKVLTAVYQQVSSLMPTTIFFIALYDEMNNEVAFPFAVRHSDVLEWLPRPLSNGLTDYVIRTRQPLLIRHKMTDVMQNLEVDLMGEVAQCWLGVPMIAGEQLLGIICVQSVAQPAVYDESHQEVLTTIAGQAAVAIQNARLYTQTDAALARRVQELDSILTTAQDGIMLLDDQWRVVAANRSLTALLNLEGRILQGQTITFWPPDGSPVLSRIGYTAEELEDECMELLSQELPRLQRQITLPSRGPDRHFERQLAPVYGAGSTIEGWLLLFRDVTEEVGLEQLRQEMTHMLVHDLRSPLSVIKGSLDVLKDELDPLSLPLADSLMEYINISSDRLLKLVDNVLDIHQFETGQVPLNQMSIPVAALFGDIRGQFEPMLAETNITLTADIAENLPPLWVDVNYMNRVLGNLVDNAIKYTEDNGRIRLWASLDSNSDMMLVGVDDKGMGIPPSVQPRLFLKFHKDLGGKGRRKGSGLGLPFCKLVVEAHGGEMWVESSGEPGEGSRFVMRLPIAA